MKNNHDNQRRSAGRIIGELSRAALTYFQHEFKTYSIGHAQVRTLHFLAQNEGVSQLELAKQLKLDKSSVTSQLRILERNGYISREKVAGDARMFQIVLTDKTREILPALKMIFLSWTETLLDGFDEEERAEIFAYLERMHENASNRLEVIKTTR